MFRTKKEKYAYVQGLKAGAKGKKPYGRKQKVSKKQSKKPVKRWTQADADRLGNDLIEAWEEAGRISKAEADFYLHRK